MSMPLTLAPAACFLVTVCLQVRQVFGAAAYDSSSMLLSAVDTIKPGDVYLRLADAVQLLEWAWTGFVPGGTAMVADEVTEMNRRLELWWRQKEGAWGVQKLRVDFTAFERWFSLCMEELMRDRVNFVRDADHYRAHANVFDKQQQHLVHRENHRHQQHSEDKGEGKVEVQSSQVPHPPGSPEALLQNYMQDCVVTYDDLYADDVDDNYFDDD